MNPEWRYVVDFRNVVIHEYFGLNVEQIFDIIKNDIVSLEKELILLLKKIPQKELILATIDHAIIDLQKARRFESIDYLKKIQLKI
ncbi:MAG: HepT-like ribonuclease domain-containing protein [bacterium]